VATTFKSALAVLGLCSVVSVVATLAVVNVNLAKNGARDYFKNADPRDFGWRIVPCNLAIDPIKRILLFKKSFVLTVRLETFGKAKMCSSKVTILAPAFGVRPEEQEQQLDSQTTTSPMLFNLLPNEVGDQEIVVTSFQQRSEVLHFVVYRYPFIPPSISLWFPAIGTLFGGMITIPWWLDRWSKKRNQKDEANSV
jgi:hypothetical protein